MKKSIITATIIFFGCLFCTAQVIAPAPPDKAVVYFARVSSLGLAINFSYFDSTTLIGKFNGPKYIRYECAPGAHIFWARSENKDFVEADLEAGKIYLIEAVPMMGAFKASVWLEPIDPQNEKDQKRISKILKLMTKKPAESFTAEELEKDTKDLEEVIKKGLEKYAEEKTKGNIMQRLERTMNYIPQPAG